MNLQKNTDIILINLITMIIGIGIYFLTNEKIEILGAVIATGISLSLGIRQYKTENYKILKELFIEFNTKYDFQGNDKLHEILENQKKVMS